MHIHHFLTILAASMLSCQANAAEQFVSFGQNDSSQLCLTASTDTIAYDNSD